VAHVVVLIGGEWHLYCSWEVSGTCSAYLELSGAYSSYRSYVAQVVVLIGGEWHL